jgi:outer membrane protein TolC
MLVSMPYQVHAQICAIAASALLLSACESYAPLPLDRRPAHAERLADLKLGSAPAGWAGGTTEIDPNRPLSAADIARLAVENNPDLRAARAARRIAEAQVLQAGLLPNPSANAQLGFVTGGPGTATSWVAGLSQDVKALVTLSATRGAARYAASKVDADLLWQEWLVIGKARLLFVDSVEQERVRQLLLEERRLLADRYARSKRAVEAGNLPLSTAAPDLAALSAVDKRRADLDRQIATRQHDLDALLGLNPDVRLSLSPDIVLPQIDPAGVARVLHELSERRPDLVALQLGYAAQEERVRGAILAQFPALAIGGIGGSDTTGVSSVGPSITIDLPIFNRNQGNIAIDRATRRQLREEYTNRFSRAVAEIRALLAEQTLLQRQLTDAEARLPEAVATAQRADAAYRAGNLDERGYVDLAATVIAQRQNIVALRQALLEGQVALATLLGAGMPIVLADPSTAETSS